jgi:SagB-type dehydrogenase family enzyme
MKKAQQMQRQPIQLPRPRLKSGYSFEKVLGERRSVREYSSEELTLANVSQLLWSAQGVTHPEGWRTAPSAGAAFPLELYLAAGKVNGLAQGLYRYRADQHKLIQIGNKDLRADLAGAAPGQEWMKGSAIIIVIAAVYDRATRKYGQRGIRYAHMEVGHAAQNVYLQAASLNLGTTLVGAFDDKRVKEVLKLPSGEQPLGLMPVGGQ